MWIHPTYNIVQINKPIPQLSSITTNFIPGVILPKQPRTKNPGAINLLFAVYRVKPKNLEPASIKNQDFLWRRNTAPTTTNTSTP